MSPKPKQGFTSIQKVLPNKLKQYKLEAAFYKHQAIKHWNEAAGKFINQAKDQTKAIDLKNGILVVACLSKELAYEIRMIVERIVYEINKLIGKSVVFGIHMEI